ncbi:MAG: PAS domain S-box protein, partial [Bacteroidia bacterium]|nr:PAS domain S-box protein [Bacteroidia bacterium]
MKKRPTNQNPKKKSVAKNETLALDMASSIIDNTTDGITAINLKGEILFWNDGATKLSGYSKEEMLGKNISKLYRKQDIPDLVERIRKAKQGEFFTNKELIMVDKFNKEHEVLLTLNGLKDASGNIAQLIGVVKDITELNKSKIELIKVKEKAERVEQKLISQLDATLNKISDGFVSLDTNWCYTYVNIKAAELLGRSQKDLIGKHIWTEFPEGVGLPFYDAYNKAFDTQETVYFEEYYKPCNRWFENRIYPSSDGLIIYFTDITEKRQAKLALKDSEERFHQAFDNSPIPVSILNLKTGKRLAVNNTFCKTFGYTKEELVNEENFKKNNIAVDQKVFRSIIEKILDKGAVFEHPFSMYTRSGEVRETLLNATRVYPDDEYVYIVSFLDVTDRKKVEIALLSSEKKFRNLAETSQVAIAILSEPPENNFLYVNPYWEKLTGYSSKEAEKLTPMDLVEPEFHKVLNKESIKQRSSGTVPENNEFKIITKSGEIKWIKFTSTTIEFNGEIANLRTGLDITKQKEIELELINAKEKAERSENYLENIISNIGEPVFVKDEQSKFLLVNNSFCEFLGLTREEIIGKTLAEDIPSEEQEIFLKIDRQVLKTGQKNINEETLTIRGGLTKTIVTRKTRYIDNYGKKYLIGAISDITDRKIAEIELKKAQEIARLGNWYLDISKGEITLSDELHKMYGFDPTLPVPSLDEHKNFFATESWELLNSSIKNTINTGKPYAIELKANPKAENNEWQWMYAQGEAVLDAGNNVIGLRGIAQDITEQKLAAEKLYESEKVLKAIFDHHFQLTGLLDTNAKILAVNKTALNFIDKKEKDVIGKFFWNTPWWDSSQKTLVKNAIEKAKSGQFVRFETTHNNNLGEKKYVDFSLNPVFDDHHNVIYIVPEGRDITERIIAEENIKETLTQLNLAVDTAKIGVWSHNMETGELVWNGELFKIFGLDPSEFDYSMESFMKMVHPEDLDILMEIQEKLIKNEVLPN